MAGRLGLLLLGCLLGLGTLEAVLRAVGTIPEVENPLYSFHRSDPLLGWIGVPRIRQRFVRPAFDVLVEHTGEGFRRPSPPPDPTATRRVLVLGDSYVWGWGVGQGEVFTDRLQTILGPGVAIHNRGVNAYSTAQQLLVLEREATAGSFDEILVVFVPNDFDDNLDEKAGRRPGFVLGKDGLVARNQPPARLMNPVARLLKRSRALGWIDRGLTGLIGGSRGRPVPEDWPPGNPWLGYHAASQEAVELMSALLLRMARVAEATGARLRIVILMESPNATQLRLLCSQRGLDCLDLAPQMTASEAEESLYLDGDGHWTPSGHRRVADLLAPHLRLPGKQESRGASLSGARPGSRSRPDR